MSALTVARSVIFGGGTAALAVFSAILVRRWLRDRRKDRERAADVAFRVRGSAYLAWLEDEFSTQDAGDF